jgi:hypothetical protein
MTDMKEIVEKHNSKQLYEANSSGKVMQRSVMGLQDDSTN